MFSFVLKVYTGAELKHPFPLNIPASFGMNDFPIWSQRLQVIWLWDVSDGCPCKQDVDLIKTDRVGAEWPSAPRLHKD